MPFLQKKTKLLPRSKQLEILTLKNGLHHSIYNVSGDKYIGEWGNNLKEGKGSLLTRSFRLYEGDWHKNYRHGFGVLASQQTNKVFTLNYRGEWKNGKQFGIGSYHYNDGSYYLGNWNNGKRSGYGQMWYADGSFYDGDWSKDKKHGNGMLVKSDGNRYEGTWAYDMKHGRGRFFHLDSGQMQEGIWTKDICVYSIIIDIPFRQTAIQPTPYPIPINNLLKLESICRESEMNAIACQVS